MQNHLLLFYKKYSKTIFDLFLIFITVCITLYIWSYIYKVAFPVLLAILIAAIIRPLSKFFVKKGFKKKNAITASLLTFVVVFFTLIATLGTILISQLIGLVNDIPTYFDYVKNLIIDKSYLLDDLLNKIPNEYIEKAKESLESVTTFATGIATAVIGKTVSVLSSFSSFIVNIALALILAYFLSYEFDDWKTTTSEKTPKTFKNIFFFLKDNVIKGISKYVIAQLKLISITFSVVLVGLLILNTGNALTIALFSAVFDLVPLLGVPVIFIPWAIYAFVVGKTKLAIGLIVIMCAAMIIRQIFEPKIAGEALGVSPFVMLATTLIFMNIFGISAVFITPLIIILITQLMDKGIIRKIIRKPDDEFESDEKIVENPEIQETETTKD